MKRQRKSEEKQMFRKDVFVFGLTLFKLSEIPYFHGVSRTYKSCLSHRSAHKNVFKFLAWHIRVSPKRWAHVFIEKSVNGRRVSSGKIDSPRTLILWRSFEMNGASIWQKLISLRKSPQIGPCFRCNFECILFRTHLSAQFTSQMLVRYTIFKLKTFSTSTIHKSQSE